MYYYDEFFKQEIVMWKVVVVMLGVAWEIFTFLASNKRESVMSNVASFLPSSLIEVLPSFIHSDIIDKALIVIGSIGIFMGLVSPDNVAVFFKKIYSIFPFKKTSPNDKHMILKKRKEFSVIVLMTVFITAFVVCFTSQDTVGRYLLFAFIMSSFASKIIRALKSFCNFVPTVNSSTDIRLANERLPLSIVGSADKLQSIVHPDIFAKSCGSLKKHILQMELDKIEKQTASTFEKWYK